MPRNIRIDVGGEIYHVINRANSRQRIFYNDKDYKLFEEVLRDAKERISINIYSYCVMPNHWHIVLSPKKDGDLAKFMAWFTMTHTQRWHVMHRNIGGGHVYQGRYKSFIVESSNYFIQVCRYVERNPVRAKLVKKAENWQWGSIWRRENGNPSQQKLLNSWPEPMPKNYLDWVNETELEEKLKIIRNSVNKGKPYDKDSWVEKVIDIYRLGSTIRNPGRPKKGS